MRQEHEEVDPKYGLPKKPKFSFAERFNSQQQQQQPKAKHPRTDAGKPTTNLASSKMKTAPTNSERKYFDSADWAQGGEVHPLHPKLFDNNADLSATSNVRRERVKRKPAKTVEDKQLEPEGTQYFDSADWAKQGDKYALKMKGKAHPALLDSSRPPSGDYGGLRKHICTSMIKKGRIYFDSADWALNGETVSVHHPRLGFDPVST